MMNRISGEDEDNLIDSFSEIIFRFEKTKKQDLMSPICKHPLDQILYLKEVFFSPIPYDIPFVDMELETKDYLKDLCFSFFAGDNTNVHSVSSVNKFDTRLRGKIDFKKAYFCSHIYEVLLFAANKIDTKHTSLALYFGRMGERTINLSTYTNPLAQTELQYKITPILSVANCIKQYHETIWHAAISTDYLGVKIPIHPNTARFFFKNRDKSFGSNRKASLRNFVKEHNRYIKDKIDPVKVKKHLRGATLFSWLGFNVKIMPSEFDLRLLQKS